MRLTLDGIKDTSSWAAAGIRLPGYDVLKIAEEGKKRPVWAHFGIGNSFRIFLGGIADSLLEQGLLHAGITCVETFDYETVDKIYDPFDNLSLSVILENDGSRRQKVIAPFSEALKGKSDDPSEWKRLMEIFAAPSLQIVSFTITEKGYAGQDYLDYVGNESIVAFPWTMIDKITPRPSEQIAADLKATPKSSPALLLPSQAGSATCLQSMMKESLSSSLQTR